MPGVETGTGGADLSWHDEAERRCREAEILAELARTLNASLDVDTVLQRVAEGARELCGCDAAVIALREPDSDKVVVRFSAGYEHDRRGDRIEPGQGAGGLVLVTGQPFRTQRQAEDPRISGDHAAIVEGSGAIAQMVVPILTEARIDGLLHVENRCARAFTDGDQSVMTRLADHAAVALHNARLHEESRQRQARLEALLEINRQLSGVRSHEALLTTIAEACAKVLECESVGFRIVEGDDLVVTGTVGDAATAMPTARLKIGESLSGIVAATGEPLVVADLCGDPRMTPLHREAALRLGYRAFLGVPVKAGDRLLGVLSARARRERGFSSDDVLVAMAFASQAAIALDNARLFAELEAHARTLQQKNDEIASFVHSISHDLKSPLVTIQGMAGLLLDAYGDALGADGRRWVDRLQENTRHMSQLIRDVLLFSRTGEDATAAEEVDLGAVVGDVLETLGAPLAARGVQVTVESLPRVWGVRAQLERVVYNLVDNALKYLGDRPDPRIEIGAVEHDDVVECRVTDNGVGIDPAYHERIFEIFRRLEDVRHSGTGVGLAVVRKIVNAAAGRVWVDSAAGQGATFCFTWPLRPTH